MSKHKKLWVQLFSVWYAFLIVKRRGWRSALKMGCSILMTADEVCWVQRGLSLRIQWLWWVHNCCASSSVVALCRVVSFHILHLEAPRQAVTKPDLLRSVSIGLLACLGKLLSPVKCKCSFSKWLFCWHSREYAQCDIFFHCNEDTVTSCIVMLFCACVCEDG